MRSESLSIPLLRLGRLSSDICILTNPKIRIPITSLLESSLLTSSELGPPRMRVHLASLWELEYKLRLTATFEVAAMCQLPIMFYSSFRHWAVVRAMADFPTPASPVIRAQDSVSGPRIHAPISPRTISRVSG